MNSRKASVECYEQIKANGYLSRRRWETYDVVFRRGPMTSNECFHIIREQRGIEMLACKSDIRARFTELQQQGVIEVVGEKLDPESHMNVCVWDVTGRLPLKTEGRSNESNKQKLQRLERVNFLLRETLDSVTRLTSDYSVLLFIKKVKERL